MNKKDERKTYRVTFEGLDKEYIVKDWNGDMAVDKALHYMPEEDKAILSRRILVLGDAEEINPEESLDA